MVTRHVPSRRSLRRHIAMPLTLRAAAHVVSCAPPQPRGTARRVRSRFSSFELEAQFPRREAPFAARGTFRGARHLFAARGALGARQGFSRVFEPKFTLPSAGWLGCELAACQSRCARGRATTECPRPTLDSGAAAGAGRGRGRARELTTPALDGLRDVAEGAALSGELVGDANRRAGLDLAFDQAARFEIFQASRQDLGAEARRAFTELTEAAGARLQRGQYHCCPWPTEHFDRRLERLTLTIDRLGHGRSIAMSLSKRKSVDRRNCGHTFPGTGPASRPCPRAGMRRALFQRMNSHGLQPRPPAHAQ
jgi:hypothetical protein